MQQSQDGVEHIAEHDAGVRGALLGVGELHLGQLQVPGAQFVPGEVVERLERLAEFVPVDIRIHLGANLFEPIEDPAVGVGEIGAVRQRARLGAVHQSEFARVEQLGDEVARG